MSNRNNFFNVILQKKQTAAKIYLQQSVLLSDVSSDEPST